MSTLFAKWNGKAFKPPSHSRFGQAVSSTDLSTGSEDAPQLSGVPTLHQIPLSTTDLSDYGHAPTSSANGNSYLSRGLPALPQSATSSVNEFGASATLPRAGQQGRNNRYGTEPSRLQSSKSTNATLSSTKNRPRTAEPTMALTQPSVYGYTAVGWGTQMDVAKAVEVVMACGQQIRARGLDSPLIFSSMALDLSAHNVRSLIQSFVQTPSQFFTSDVKFANPHDLAAVLKWSLARLGRVFAVPVPTQEHVRKGEPIGEENIFIQQRGFLDMEVYTRWAGYEKRNNYPASAFGSFLDNLSSSPLALLVSLFSLLSSTSSYSLKNGMTPSRLSRLFGSHLFGLPEDETFEKTYEAYVKASNATEHLFLAYIRDMGTIESLPIRLADHVRGYPAMLSSEASRPSRSVRGVPMTHVNRAVRLYSLDLLQTACEMDLADVCQEWKACCATSDAVGKDPQLSDRFRKLINLRGGQKQGRSHSSPKAPVEVEHYASLVDKQWGDFLNEGFSAPDESKLTFDLRESERKARSQRPGAVQWSQFEKSGFVLADDGLASVLNFDDGLREDMQRWPAERAELMEKLQKASKMIPTFPYDTTPNVISSPSKDRSVGGQWERKPVSRFDELFAEVFADVLLGNGWSNRDEQTHRSANFAVVQYKSRPTQSTVGSQKAGSSNQTAGFVGEPDDRVDAAWFVVEEIVPLQYRSDLEAAGKLKNRSRPSLRKLNIFKRRKEEAGVGPTMGTGRNDRASFDDVFRPGAGGTTKRLQLSKEVANHSPVLERKSSVSTIRGANFGSEVDDMTAGQGGGLRLMTTLRSKTMRMKRRGREDDDKPPSPPPKAGIIPSQSFTSNDFETRSLHDPDFEHDYPEETQKRGFLKANKSAKRQSKDDSWLDVMIRANGFRMAGQDATMGGPAERTVGSSVGEQPRLTPSPTLPEGNGYGAETGLASNTTAASFPQIKRKAVKESEGNAASVSKDTLQVAGWTREDSNAAVTLPKREASLPRLTPDETNGPPSPLPQSKDKSQEEAGEGEEEEGQESPAKIAYLRPLPPRSSTPSDMDERERARETRIQAAKERAKELRAGLNPVAVQQLEKRKDMAGTKPVAALLTPTKSTSEPPRTPSPRSSSSPAVTGKNKDDPFAKDRVSGRVASVASKFGGPTAKPLTPQSSGNSVSASASSPGPSPNAKTGKDRGNQSFAYPPALPAEPSTVDPNEPASRPSLESNLAQGVDNDSLYPDDAASNFSRDTNPEEELVGRPMSLRQGGSIAASNAASNGSTPLPSMPRREEDDKVMAMPPSFRVPYQPGMPLSNLEEESESVVSSSTNAA